MIDSKEFLKATYQQLEFETGVGYFKLLNSDEDIASMEKISWIRQAREIGAESIYFVNDYPAVVFFNLEIKPSVDTYQIEEQIRELHVKVWNTSLIPLFFVALPGELRIYSAYQKPIENLNAWRAEDRWLNRINEITEITKLWEYSRSQIESGNLFAEKPNDFNRANRVDKWLLQNLRLLRKKLEETDRSKRTYVHALIGRSICTVFGRQECLSK